MESDPQLDASTVAAEDIRAAIRGLSRDDDAARASGRAQSIFCPTNRFDTRRKPGAPVHGISSRQSGTVLAPGSLSRAINLENPQ